MISRAKGYMFRHWAIPPVKNEYISKAILKKFLPKNPIAVDCGSFDGFDALELVRVLGARVHAFEPVAEVYQALELRARHHSQIKTYPFALSSKSGRFPFYVSGGASKASSSLLIPKEHLIDHPQVTFDRSVWVDTVTLDDWAEQYRVPQVDLLWLDMQGSEMETLEASHKVMAQVKVIHTEVSMKETYWGVGLYGEFKQWLESIGFRLEVEAIPSGWDMGNALFVRP